ncbi:FAD-dependent monooxygenase [Isoptericola sp. BMS4]|uniref:FAD-dependent monooxygenase n=1 Tax=Isoptericola sp. BMS4 TaxID=2527875 RepID=UPI0014202741|nr:FAD-dependent monooxygenase [Isoptericola sp. BMS4]
MSPDVLVVGAGPTGLTTALQAHDLGAAVRVVERRPTAFRPSRAMILHPRTLEALRRLGAADAILERADHSPRARVHVGGRVLDVRLADVAWPSTPYPHLTLVRQADVEAVLAEALHERGVPVERGVELLTARTGPHRAHATLRTGGSTEEVACAFVAGCDGPDSTVRRAARIGWRGGTYRTEVVLADAELDGDLAPGMLHVVVGRAGLLFVFALGEGATWRVLATRPATGGGPSGQPGDAVPAAQVAALLDRSGLRTRLAALRWSARVPLQHRLATAFRRGRLFLAGDAAHAHSPAAAQGMNTGILDAANLGWKLAVAARGGGGETLLASYEAERRPVARRVLALTHVVFAAEASTGPLPALLRARVLPVAAPAVPALAGEPHLMATVVRLLSQDWATYRRSPLSAGAAGRRPRPGDRLPDRDVTCRGRTRRLHDLTSVPGFHVLLDRDAPPGAGAGLGPLVRTHRLTSSPGRGVVVVRPDGHVGLSAREVDPDDVAAWLARAGATRAGVPAAARTPGPRRRGPAGTAGSRPS